MRNNGAATVYWLQRFHDKVTSAFISSQASSRKHCDSSMYALCSGVSRFLMHSFFAAISVSMEDGICFRQKFEKLLEIHAGSLRNVDNIWKINVKMGRTTELLVLAFWVLHYYIYILPFFRYRSQSGVQWMCRSSLPSEHWWDPDLLSFSMVHGPSKHTLLLTGIEFPSILLPVGLKHATRRASFVHNLSTREHLHIYRVVPLCLSLGILLEPSKHAISTLANWSLQEKTDDCTEAVLWKLVCHYWFLIEVCK